MKKLVSFIVLLLLISNLSYTQVSISTDNSAPNNSAMLDIKSTNKGFLPPRMTQAERNAIASPATGLMIFQTDNTPGYYCYNGTGWALTSAPTHYIGELFEGGIVFWVDNTGQHGLIVSLVDISSSSLWSNVTSTMIGTPAESSWNGQGNSTAIMGQSGFTYGAAKLCDDYSNANYNTGIYSDWYLPAIDELSLIYHSRYILNKNIEGVSGANILGDVYYWSSTEHGSSFAWYYYFGFGRTASANKIDLNWVRAVRAF
jgi:hypothetical protein